SSSAILEQSGCNLGGPVTAVRLADTDNNPNTVISALGLRKRGNGPRLFFASSPRPPLHQRQSDDQGLYLSRKWLRMISSVCERSIADSRRQTGTPWRWKASAPVTDSAPTAARSATIIDVVPDSLARPISSS